MRVTAKELPITWHRAQLLDVCDVILGQSPPGNTYNAKGIGLPFFQGKAEFGNYYPTPVKWCSAPTKIAEPNDVLISVRAPVGPTNLCPSQACIGRGLAAIRPRQGMPSRYLLYALRATVRTLVEKATGSTFEAISGSTLRSHVIPIPPIEEQQRIVAEIEKQFTRLEAGVAALKRVQANLKRYRTAVLKAACEGRLVATEADLARNECRAYETGEQLLARILTDRRQNWQGHGKYKEPTAPDTVNLSPLPEGWTWTGFEQLSDGTRYAIKAGPFGSALKKSVYVTTGFKIYGQEQVINGDPYFGDYFISTQLFNELKSCAIKPWDILISLVGTTGKVLILPEDCAPGIINPRLLKLSLNRTGVSIKFVKILMESAQTRAFFKLAAHGGTMEILNLGILKSLPIPLPPLAEQERIVAEVERRLSVIEEQEAVVSASLQRAARLRQSILERAFSGRLLS